MQRTLYGFLSLFGFVIVHQGFPFFALLLKLLIVYFVYVFLIKVTTPELDFVCVSFILATVYLQTEVAWLAS